MTFNFQKDITLVIPTKNDTNLNKCLHHSSKFFDNIFVIESGDRNVSIDTCNRYKANLVYFDWDGKFPKKRNWALQNNFIKTDWVLFLDADEYVTDEFINGINIAWKTNQHQIYSGFWLSYTNYFMGKKLKYGIRQQKLALFRKSCGAYERIVVDPNDNFDMEVHEHPIINGKVSKIGGMIDHQDYRGLQHYLKKHIDYSEWETKRYLGTDTTGSHLTFRQRFKYWLLPNSIFCIIYFLLNYIFFLGFLDGRKGLIYSVLKCQYFYNISILISEKR